MLDEAAVCGRAFPSLLSPPKLPKAPAGEQQTDAPPPLWAELSVGLCGVQNTAVLTETCASVFQF